MPYVSDVFPKIQFSPDAKIYVCTNNGMPYIHSTIYYMNKPMGSLKTLLKPSKSLFLSRSDLLIRFASEYIR